MLDIVVCRVGVILSLGVMSVNVRRRRVDAAAAVVVVAVLEGPPGLVYLGLLKLVSRGMSVDTGVGLCTISMRV